MDLKREGFNEHGYRNLVKHILPQILRENEDDLVLAMPPGGLHREYKTVFDKTPDVVTVWLKDRAKNILGRLIFTDDEDVLIEDIELSEEELARYYEEIKTDIEYYRATHSKAKLHFSIDGMSAQMRNPARRSPPPLPPCGDGWTARQIITRPETSRSAACAALRAMKATR